MRRKIYQGLMALLIFFTVILANTIFIFYDDGFVKNEFEKFSTESILNNPGAIDTEIRDYLTGESSKIETDFLNEKEKKHLEDVKRLVTMGKILIALFIFLITVSLFEFNKNEMGKIGNFLGIYLILFVLMSFIVNYNFDIFFDLFHRAFFTNELWMMGPQDKITLLYPASFFLDASIAVGKRSVVWLLITLAFLNSGFFLAQFRKLRSLAI